MQQTPSGTKVEIEAIRRAHERNMAAMLEATQLVVEGAKTLIRRQAELVRAGIEESNSVIRDLAEARTQEERLAVQAAAAKSALDQSLLGSRELAEIALRSGNEAIDIINRRLREGVDEAIDLAGAARG
jgi:phasin family protein